MLYSSVWNMGRWCTFLPSPRQGALLEGRGGWQALSPSHSSSSTHAKPWTQSPLPNPGTLAHHQPQTLLETRSQSSKPVRRPPCLSSLKVQALTPPDLRPHHSLCKVPSSKPFSHQATLSSQLGSKKKATALQALDSLCSQKAQLQKTLFFQCPRSPHLTPLPSLP